MISYALTKTNENNVQLIKGNYYNNKHKYVKKKVVVFDLDETIGHFHHLQAISKCLSEWLKRKLFQDEFNLLLDLFPEFFAPAFSPFWIFSITKNRKTICSSCIFTQTTNATLRGST